VPTAPETPPPAQWEVPESDEKLLDLTRNEFRIRFSAEPWNGRIASAQVLSGQRLTSLESSNTTPGADYCIWLPGVSSVRTLLSDQQDATIVYGLGIHDQDAQSSTSLSFEFNTSTGDHLGTLKCVFPHTSSAPSVAYGRWTSIVGDLLKFEIRP